MINYPNQTLTDVWHAPGMLPTYQNGDVAGSIGVLTSCYGGEWRLNEREEGNACGGMQFHFICLFKRTESVKKCVERTRKTKPGRLK